jgi:hypothetical protein
MTFMPNTISKWIYRIYLRVGADKSTTGKLYHLWIRPLRRCRTKHMPFSSSPLWLNMFRLFVIFSLTQLYRYTPEIFLFSTATFKYTYRSPSDELEKNIQRTWLGLLSVIETDTATSDGFFICIRNSLDRPCVAMPSWSSLKCKVSLLKRDNCSNADDANMFNSKLLTFDF